MSSIVRRAGSKLAKMIQRTADPSPVSGSAQLYSKDVSGVTKMFVMDSAGTPLQVGEGTSSNVAVGNNSLEFLDKITVAVAGTDFTFSATGNGLYQYDVNGDVDEKYVLISRIKKTVGGTVIYTLRPNNLTTNQQHESISNATGTVTGASQTDIRIFSMSTRDEVTWEQTIFAKTGFDRIILGRGASSENSADDVTTDSSASVWREQVTNITSLVIHADTASGIGIGSTFELYRVRAIAQVESAPDSGAFEYLDTITTTSDVTTVTFSSTGDGVRLAPLDGNTDEEYYCRYHIVQNDATGPGYNVRPNGITTNQDYENVFSSNGAASATTGTDLRIAGATNNAEGHAGWFSLVAKTGLPRYMESHSATYDTTPSFTANSFSNRGALWNDTTTNITSLAIVATSASGIRSGSRFELFRRKSMRSAATSAATYERQVTAAVDPSALVTTEQTTGGVTFTGSLIGFSARLEEAVTAGTITVNIKVGGVTKLTGVLNTTNTTFIRASAGLGVYAVVPGDNVSVEIVPSGYTNTGAVVSGITVNTTLVNSGIFQPVDNRRNVTAVKTAAYTAIINDYIPCDPTAGTFSVTLPSASSSGSGAVIRVKHDSTTGNSFSVVRSGTDTLDNLTTLVVNTQEQYEFTSDGVSKWRIG